MRVRLRDGTTATRRFEGGAPLAAVRAWVESLDAHDSMTYSLVLAAPPRTVFGVGQGGASLTELGLAPQAALFVRCEDE